MDVYSFIYSHLVILFFFITIIMIHLLSNSYFLANRICCLWRESSTTHFSSSSSSSLINLWPDSYLLANRSRCLWRESSTTYFSSLSSSSSCWTSSLVWSSTRSPTWGVKSSRRRTLSRTPASSAVWKPTLSCSSFSSFSNLKGYHAGVENHAALSKLNEN